MPRKENFKENSLAVQAHLTITQNVISRMAANSSSCKTFCITIVSAVLVLVADKGKPQFALIALIPTCLFFILDTYYLSLERSFRASYNSFIEKLHTQELNAIDLYAVKPQGNPRQVFANCLASFSIWPFYLTLSIMIFLTKCLVMQTAVISPQP